MERTELISVGFAQLHDTIFVGGKNLSDKLDIRHQAGIKIEYDKKDKELLVTWNNETMHVPEPNVRGYIPKDKLHERKIVNLGHAQTLGSSATAQIETPMSHVHAGPGKGRSK